MDGSNEKHSEETHLLDNTMAQTDERKRLSKELEVTDRLAVTKSERIPENKEKSERKVVDVKVILKGTGEKENRPLVEPKSKGFINERESKNTAVQVKHPVPVRDINMVDVQGKDKPRIKYSVEQEQVTITPSEKYCEKHGPPKCPPPRSPTLGHRQLPEEPPPRAPQTPQEREVGKNNILSQGPIISRVQKASTPKPLSELNSNKTVAELSPIPKSTKTRAAPPVPQSSGSAVGRSHATSVNSTDTSGYPESFLKRKSRDSRELSDVTTYQLGRLLHGYFNLGTLK